MRSTDLAVRLSQEILERQPSDSEPLFAKALAYGIRTDYTALIEKKKLETLGKARESHQHALELVQKHPQYADGYLTTGISEYFMARLPFFVKWIFKLPEVEGTKEKAQSNLELAAVEGRYLRPFARILLAVIAIREKEPEEARKWLEGLVRDYPQNPLFRRELEKLRSSR